jgi:hypothetical protein
MIDTAKISLRDHLNRAEVEYIADKPTGGYPETFRWEPDIKAHARKMGFRFNGKVNEIDSIRWITTTNGINIYLEDGFVCRIPKRK